MYLVFDPFSDSEFLKLLEFSRWWQPLDVFCDVNEMILGLHPRTEAGCQKNQPWIRELEILVSPRPPGSKWSEW